MNTNKNDNSNALIKLAGGGEITKAQAEEIYEKTGYMVWIPEQAELFEKVVTAVQKLEQIPDYYKKIQVQNISQVLQSKGCLNIVNLNKFYGHARTQAQLAIAINDLCNFFNISKNMTVEQIAQTVDIIINTFPINNLTLADIKLCFSWIMLGKYGKIYDRMDGGVILDALNAYWKQRCDIAEDQLYQQHLQNKSGGCFEDRRSCQDNGIFLERYRFWKDLQNEQ